MKKTRNLITKSKIPPFHSYNKMFFWMNHSYPYEMNICLGLKGDLNVTTLKQAVKEIFLETRVLQTRITTCLFFTRRTFIKENKKFNVDSIFQVNNTAKLDPGGIKTVPDTETTAFLNKAIDLKHEPPVKFYLASKVANEPVFIIKLHHTVSDAEGAYFLLTKIFQRYNTLIGGKNSIELPNEPGNYSLHELEKLIPAEHDKQAEAIEKSAPAAFFKDSSAPYGTIKVSPFIIDKKHYAAIKEITKNTRYSINDIIVSAVVMATHAMLKKRKIPAEHLRIEQLVNLRRHLNIQGGLSNFISAFSILLNKNELKNIGNILETVHVKTKTTLSKKEYLRELFKIIKLKFISSRRLAHITKNTEKYLCNNNFSYFSASVSNPGKLDSVLEAPHNCKLQYIWGAMHPHPSFGSKWISKSISGNLIINYIYADPIITDNTAKEMVDLFKAALQKIILTKEKIVHKGKIS